MISGKMVYFPVFDCILENAPKNILRYLVRCKKKLKKKTPTTTSSTGHHILHPQQSIGFHTINLSSKSTAHLKPTPLPISSPPQPTRTTTLLPKNHKNHHNKAPHHRVQKTHKSQQVLQQKPTSPVFKNPQAMNNSTHRNRPPHQSATHREYRFAK